MEISVVSTGVVRGKRSTGLRRYLPGGWSGTALPINVVIVTHPAGVCLFDAGQVVSATRPGYHPRWHPWHRLARFELSPQEEISARLDELGIAVTDVRWVVLSHLHTDHVGGIRTFAHAEIIASRTEWERARGMRGMLRGYIPHRWPVGLTPRLVELRPSGADPASGALDLAEDGRLLLVSTPSHTPGHLALVVASDDTRALCCGDTATSISDLERVDPGLAQWCRREGAVLIPSHGAPDRSAQRPGGNAHVTELEPPAHVAPRR